MPVLAFYAYGQASIYWLDFRSSTGTDRTYAFFRSLTRYATDPTGGGRNAILSGSLETGPWPRSLGLPFTYRLFPSGIPYSYGDVDFMAVTPLHGHSMHGVFDTSSMNNYATPFTILSSPRDPPQ